MPQRAMISLEKRPRYRLLDGPTPIQRLARLERALGLAESSGIYVKRDDLMGLGGGGSKLRKLEFLVGDALEQGCDTFITTGARQSNHARLSAAAAAHAGLACELVLTDTVPREDEAYRHNGNVLLDQLFGATVHRQPGDVDALTVARRRAAELIAGGRRPYIVGAGGSSPIGCLGYAACACEIVRQEQELGLRFGRIVVPNGSSGTHAGLAAGLKALGHDASRVTSFSVLASVDRARETTIQLAGQALDLIDPDRPFTDGEIAVSGGQLGAGYGIPTAAMLDTVRLVARTEGLLFDPVYGGKAFAGLLDAMRSAAWAGDGPVLFVMTGGLPGLFAYEPTFRPEEPAA
ncbi:D-cysteine desulfhydrase family protein [uncultured Jannaschia sp.]|uniref:D-cysteine desulfhydrase family protein n=1 Tax=uncultured Jannaschia sp. TaxID=293347 RepID=UPI0026061B2A|nr:D-cysteine desulfhydrase family protein [uncultured Jannaschia sp.]